MAKKSAGPKLSDIRGLSETYPEIKEIMRLVNFFLQTGSKYALKLCMTQNHTSILPCRLKTRIVQADRYPKNKTRTAVHHPGFATPKTYLLPFNKSSAAGTVPNDIIYRHFCILFYRGTNRNTRCHLKYSRG